MNLGMKMPERVFGFEVSLLSVFVVPAVMLLMFFLSLSVVIMPKISEIKKIKSDRLAVEKKRDLVKAKRNYLMAVDEVELKKKTEFLEKALLAEKDAYILVGLIREVAGNHGFYVQSFSVSPGEISSKEEEAKVDSEKSKTVATDRIPISFSVAGEKNRYLEFILALEKSLPVLAISKFEMSSSDKLAILDLMVMAFYVEEKAEYGKVDLDLNDLILSEEEDDLLARLSEYELLGTKGGMRGGGDFMEYDREDPFY